MRSGSLIIGIILLSGCYGIKHYSNASGMPRPKQNDVFHYNTFKSNIDPCSQLDTNAIYVWGYYDSTSRRGHYDYFRFMDRTHVYMRSDTGAIRDPGNFEAGYIGYYYILGKQLRIELFRELYGKQGALRKTFGYFSHDTLYTYNAMPESFGSRYHWTARSSTQAWIKQPIESGTFIKPNW